MKRLTKVMTCPDGTKLYDFANAVVGEYMYDHKKGVRALFEKLCDLEDKLDQGYVTESNVSYKRKTYMRPVKHNYSDDEHPNYYKYSCPVCDMLGNRHQVTVGDTNCPLCNVNLLWEGYFD